MDHASAAAIFAGPNPSSSSRKRHASTSPPPRTPARPPGPSSAQEPKSPPTFSAPRPPISWASPFTLEHPPPSEAGTSPERRPPQTGRSTSIEDKRAAGESPDRPARWRFLDPNSPDDPRGYWPVDEQQPRVLLCPFIPACERCDACCGHPFRTMASQDARAAQPAPMIRRQQQSFMHNPHVGRDGPPMGRPEPHIPQVRDLHHRLQSILETSSRDVGRGGTNTKAGASAQYAQQAAPHCGQQLEPTPFPHSSDQRMPTLPPANTTLVDSELVVNGVRISPLPHPASGHRGQSLDPTAVCTARGLSLTLPQFPSDMYTPNSQPETQDFPYQLGQPTFGFGIHGAEHTAPSSSSARAAARPEFVPSPPRDCRPTSSMSR